MSNNWSLDNVVAFSSKCALIFRVMQAGQSVRSAPARPPAALGRLLLPYGQSDNKYYRICMSSYISSVPPAALRLGRQHVHGLGGGLRQGWSLTGPGRSSSAAANLVTPDVGS